jgi:hypothetical protein
MTSVHGDNDVLEITIKQPDNNEATMMTSDSVISKVGGDCPCDYLENCYKLEQQYVKLATHLLGCVLNLCQEQPKQNLDPALTSTY